MKRLLFVCLVLAFAAGVQAQHSTGGCYRTSSGITCTDGSTFTLESGATLSVEAGATMSLAATPAFTLGLTVTGAAVNLNASSNFALNLATGTSTGTVTIGGTGTQAIAIGNGAGIKTVALGSATTSSATTISGGTGDITVTSTDDIVMLSTSAGGIFSFNNTAGGVVNVGTDDTTADDINLGSAKDDITLSAEDISLTTADDMDLTSTSAGGIIALGGTPGVVINIGTDNTTKDTIIIGSAKDDVGLVLGGGTESASGNVCSDRCVSGICQTVCTLTAVAVAVTDPGGAAAYGGVLLYTFPAGRILALGLVADITATEASATISDTWDGDVSFGTTAADVTATLHNPTTEDDWTLTRATTTAIASVAASDTESVIAQQVYFDGHTTPVPLYLNYEIDDGSISTGGADALAIAGTVTITWINLGDN